MGKFGGPDNGRHGAAPEKALTSVQVRALKSPGRYADGHGLYLVVDPSGAKRWLLRIVVQGRRRDIGLGGVGLISLAEAREKALTYRKTARDGGDPLAERKKARATLPTFAEAAELVHGEHQSTWKNSKHAAQWITTLRTYAFPHLGAKRIDQIETPDILRALSPIWLTKPRRRGVFGSGSERCWTGQRRLAIEAATTLSTGWRKACRSRASGKNITRLYPMPRCQPSFAQLRAISGPGEISRLAFEFLILTAARTGEVLGARWDEIDEAEALWTVPSARMKAGREHRVPLSERALEILVRARKLEAGTKLVFRAVGASDRYRTWFS